MAGGKKNQTLRTFIMIGCITLVMCFFVWTRLQNTRLKREQNRLKDREREELLENNRLKLEWARLTSPKRLEEIGGEKYNLSRPRPDQVIVVKEPK